MNETSFLPSSKTIAAGTKVQWHNTDETQAHDVKSGTRNTCSGLFCSGDLLSGDWFTYTFAEPGSYSYFCSIHFGMDGTINVTE